MDLLSLPSAAFCDVVCDRLSFEDFVRLDSAFCCQGREVWLRLVKSKQFTLHAMVDLSCLDEAVQWLLRRDIKVSNIEFGYTLKESNARLVSKYLRRYGSFVRSVHFIGRENTHEMNLTATCCRNLTRVSVEGATLTSAYTNVLHYNPNIQHLLCEEVECEQPELMERLSLHKLQTFRVDEFNAHENTGSLWHATAHSTSLNTVVWENSAFETEDWDALIANCPQLRSFAWNSAADGGGVCLLEADAAKLVHLVNLSAFDNDTVSDTTTLAIAKMYTSLRTLNIQHCQNVTDIALRYLAEHSGTTLEVLYVDIHNPESTETDKILETFSQKSTKLSYLNINCGDQVLCAGRGTSLLVRGCPALHTLVVNRHEVICRSSREFIADRRPDLKLLVHNASTEYDILSMPI